MDASNSLPSMPVVVRLWCSKEVPTAVPSVSFGKYRLEPIPSGRSLTVPFGQELLLQFVDQWEKGQVNSNPVEEASYVLAWLALVEGAETEYKATRINNVEVDIFPQKKYPHLSGKAELAKELEELHAKLLSLEPNLFQQYVRSCLAYQSAVSMFEKSPTLAFFLLVVAVECVCE